MDKIKEFLLSAKRKTYSGDGAEGPPSRPGSHDLMHEDGELKYIDSYFGGSKFCGEEALYKDNVPIWSMNYYGRVLDDLFNGDFLKESLQFGSVDMPYRGPKIYRSNGYEYLCTVEGDFSFFYGHEEIFKNGKKVYQCLFHGGEVI